MKQHTTGRSEEPTGPQAPPSVGRLILQWINDEDRTLGYLSTKSAITTERLIDIITNAAAATSFEVSALALATALTDQQLSDAAAGTNPPDPPSAPDPLQCLTVKDVASLLQVSTDTVRNAIEVGSIPSFVVGQRNIRVPRLALEQHLVQAGGAA